MLANEQAVTVDTLIPECQTRFDAGLRLVGISAVEIKTDSTFDVLYHFDKDLQVSHLRLNVPKADPVPSISGVYFAALLAENEIKDQFGVNFQNIVIDFGCTLYLEPEVVKSPFCTFTFAKKEKVKEEA
ncbi:NADH-quinone oxidoreductase subunit C [Fundidesulfovibrio soli]|uniref:NADH-quinone oxidoreductase subunit C n=1 Tax=Fundidesulfovibrio soli TaxID=2922716 RepID=UPI001FAF9253|nr:NADH-quinone oxidoreductase subunit C [Fundidesulfovibrio soli]